MISPIDRRVLLRLAAAAALAGTLPRSAWAAARLSQNPFTLGVASGSPTDRSIVLWTRLAPHGVFGPVALPGPITVHWELADDDQFRKIVRHGQAQALPELAHAVHVEVEGFAPDRWYFYRFRVGSASEGWESPVGLTRTFPPPDSPTARLRIAYASCQRWEHGYFSAWRHMQGESLDAVLFLGDYIYEYPNASHAVRRPSGGWVLTLADYRARYALHRGEADLQAMHAACPWIVTWDDHEVQNDYAGLAPGLSGDPVPDFSARRAAAYQAWYEHMPVPARVLTRAVAGLASGAEMRIYGSVAFGQLATVHLLDDRQYRDPQVCTPDGKPGSGTFDAARCPALSDPRRSLLGGEQEAWLDASLAASARAGRTWDIVAQQSLFGRRDFRPGPGTTLWNDAWDGYPASRDRLLSSLTGNGVRNPVFFGGDVHENWVGHVKADYTRPESAVLGVEFCGTSITSRSSGNDKLPARLAENPHFIFADSERRGYGVAEFTPKSLTTTLRVVDDVTRPVTRIETLAVFVVEAGRPVIARTA